MSLVTADVHARLSPDLRADSCPLGLALVPGEQRPVAIHEVFRADPLALRQDKIATRAALAAALAAIQERRLFEAAAHPDDPALPALLEERQRRRTTTLS